MRGWVIVSSSENQNPSSPHPTPKPISSSHSPSLPENGPSCPRGKAGSHPGCSPVGNKLDPNHSPVLSIPSHIPPPLPTIISPPLCHLLITSVHHLFASLTTWVPPYSHPSHPQPHSAWRTFTMQDNSKTSSIKLIWLTSAPQVHTSMVLEWESNYIFTDSLRALGNTECLLCL